MEIGDDTTTITIITTNTAATKNNTNTNNFNILLKGKNVLRRIIFVNRAMFQGVWYVNILGISDEHLGTFHIE